MTTKVFVGNLAFQTTDQALAEAFQDCGKVKSGVVITRGRRSLGYGFVEFEAPESALEAVKSKNNTLLKGRTLKVELASDNPVRSERVSPHGGSPSNASQKNDPNASNNPPPGGQGPNRTGGPRRKRNNNRRRQRVKGTGSSGDNNINNNSGERQQNKNTADQAGGAGSNIRGRRRRITNPPPINNEDRVLSRTAVFVANLPFPVKDEDLLSFFKDNNPKAAHVVVTRNGRSRGYGFVDFEHEKDQALAIETKNNAKFLIGESERVITVTPSYKTQEVTPENN